MKKLSGLTTALITPFQNGEVDYKSLEKLVEFQLAKKVDGFVINGTTAESPTLLADERRKIFKRMKSICPEKTGLIMGTGSNSTAQTIENSKEAEKEGADACLVVVPYYNKPTQQGLFEHFKAVAESVNIPVILYNVPGRTITSLEIETIEKLSQHPNILGIKEATGDITFAKKIREKCGKQFLLLSGDDGTYDDFMELALGDGVISVASHVIPEEMKTLKIKQNKDLIDLLFIEANPIPVKMALYQMGIIASPELRLPLTTMSKAPAEKLRANLKQKGLCK